MLHGIADCPEMMAKAAAGVPSVKGSLFFIAQADLAGQIQKGKISREDLEDLLTPEQLELVDAKVQVALWYPIDAFNAFVRISSQVAPRS